MIIMEIMKKALLVYITLAFVFIVLGICLLAWPHTSLRVICYAFGAALLILGIIRLSQFIKNKENDRSISFQFNLILGVFFIIVGALLVIFPSIIMPILPVLIGIIIAADGIYKIKVALDARSFGHEKWGLIVVVSLFTIVFGFSLIINSGEVTTALIMLIGISLLIDGAQNLITIISTFKLMSTLVLKEDAANAEFKEEDIPQAESDDVKAEEIRPEDMIIEDKKEDGE